MVSYFMKNRMGQFLFIGLLFIILGFVFIPIHDFSSTISFYIAIIFLGFFAAKDAVVDTLKSKTPNVDLLMILAAIGAVVIHYESEGALLLLIFAAAEALEDYASSKSTKAIEKLMAQVPSTAQVLQDNGEIVEVNTDTLKIGDIVVVAKGEQIPIDGFADRSTMVNESMLTGESVPVKKSQDEEVFAGTINEGDVFHLRVNKSSNETVFSNIIRMVEEAQNRPSNISKFIDRIESKYVIGVLVIVPVFIIILYYVNDFTFEASFYRGMILLTVASPCALVASVTPATLSAISNGARNGVLFKGGEAMEALSTMDILYSDKTGTLTYGQFELVDYEVERDVLKEVVYMEQQSSHPIAKAIVNAFQSLHLDNVRVETVEEIAGTGMKKGNIIIGKPSAFDDFKDPYHYREKAKESNTTIFVGKNQQMIGYLSLADQVRKESKEAVSKFQDAGIRVDLLTGDNELVARKVAREVGVREFVAACLPEDKINYIDQSQSTGKVVGMIGDGINDAPALANADIGIAMGSGSSVAMESADVVIVKNNLLKLFDSFKVSHKLNRIILQNVFFSIGVIIILIVLNLFGFLNLPTAVVFHEGSTILVIINGLRLLIQHTEREKHDTNRSLEKARAS